MIYGAFLFFIILVLPALIPLALPFVMASGLYRIAPKWPYLLRYSISLLLVSLMIPICVTMIVRMLKVFHV
jgi:hypothetical protein